MKKERKKFNFMRSFYEAVEKMPKKERPQMYEAIIKYSFDDNFEPNFTGNMAIVWILIKPILDKNYQQFKNGSGNKPN